MQSEIDDLIRDLTSEISLLYRHIADQVGLNQTDLMSLFFIRNGNGALTPKALAENLGMTSGATAILLNRLEARDFIVRSPHPTDRRAVLLSLGAAAKEQGFLQIRQSMMSLNAEVIDRLSDEEAAIIRNFFRDLLANTRDALAKYRSDEGVSGKSKLQSRQN